MEAACSLKESQLLHIPRYDKSLRHGRGDRASFTNWTKIFGNNKLNILSDFIVFNQITIGPIDVIVLEGWMLGFQALNDDQDPRLDKYLGLKVMIHTK